ncbi:MAG: circadian clock KaiB domain protein [Myxococcaceae bacterium]|nr:circadian clock KaiB domain protein [Myxococcaceae bacterium]
MPERRDATADFERAAAENEQAQLVLRLFVAGNTPRSQRAIVNLRALCEEHFASRHDLEVIDIYQQPDLAREHQILVVPTLIREAPAPPRRIVGDLSNTEVVLAALQTTTSKSPAHGTTTDPAKKKDRRR